MIPALSSVPLFLWQAILFLGPGLAAALWLMRRYSLSKLYFIPLAGLLSCLLGYAVFWLYLGSTPLGVFLSNIMSMISLGAIVWLALPAQRAIWQQRDAWMPLTLWLLVAFFYSHVTLSCSVTSSPQQLDHYCHLNGITIDNELPRIFAERVYNNQEKLPIGDWLGSDRPPLQAGITLLQAPLTLSPQFGGGTYFLLAVLLQCLWMPVIWCLGRNLGLQDKQLAFMLTFCIASSFFFFNSIFTWPKLLAGALGVLAIILLLFEKSSVRTWGLAGLAGGAAMLAHSGVIFTLLPAGLLFLLPRYRVRWQYYAVALGCAALLLLPWFLYQKLYDPPGDRLLKWHIAGHEPIDERSLPRTFVDSYTQTPLVQIAKNKATNFAALFGKSPHSSHLYSEGIVGKVRDFEFRYFIFGLGLLNLGWLFLLSKRFRKRISNSGLKPRRLWQILGIAGTATIIWPLILFGPYMTFIHHGSYATMLLLFVGLAVVLTYLLPKYQKLLLALQIGYFILFWIIAVWGHGTQDYSSRIWAILSGAAIALCLAYVSGIKVWTFTQKPRAQLKQLSARLEAFLNRYWRIIVPLVLLAAAVIIVSRRPETIFNPQFWAEDGRYWYAQAYNEGPFAPLLTTYGGYFVVVYRLVASFSLLFPLELAPLIFNLAAMGFQLLPLVLLLSSRVRHIVPNRWAAIIASLIYVAIPNSTEVIGNLTNIQWHLGVASFLVLVANKPPHWKWRVYDSSVLVATGLSGPLVVILLPIAFFLWYIFKKTQQRLNAFILLGLAILQMIGIFFLSHYQRVGAQPDADLLKLAKMFVGQIFTGGLLGEKAVDLFYGQAWQVVIVLILGLSLIGYAVWRGPLWLKLANAYSVMLITAMLMSLRPTKGFDTWWGLTNPTGGQRYWYIPILVWVATLAWLAFAAKVRWIRIVSTTLLIALLFYGIPTDWKVRTLADLQFKDQARIFESLPPGSEYGIQLNPGGKDWIMKLIKK